MTGTTVTKKKLGRPKGSKNKKKGKAGGARVGAGRKPKADEIKMIEMLDKAINTEEVLDTLSSLIHQSGDLRAIALYLGYRWGKPKETKDISINTEQPLFNIDLDDE